MQVQTGQGPAEVTLAKVGKPSFLLVMTHGAGGGVETRDVLAAGEAARGLGATVALVLQPYRVRGASAPGNAEKQDAAWLEIIAALRKANPEARQPLSRRDIISMVVLVAIIPVLAVASVGNQQIFNSYLVWGEKAFSLTILGIALPVQSLISLDSIISTITMLLVILFWRWWAKRWTEPNELTKIIIGVALSSLGPLALAAAAASAVNGHHASLGWAIAFHLLNDFGFANVFPVGLALYSRASPKGYAGIMIPFYYLSLALGNFLVGYLGTLLEKMPAVSFWLLHAGLIAGAAAVLLVVRAVAGHTLAPDYGHVPGADAKAAT